MIITEFYRTREDGIPLYKTYSDKCVKIRCVEDNSLYDDAINVRNSGCTFVETDIPTDIDDLDTVENLGDVAKRLFRLGFVTLPEISQSADFFNENAPENDYFE